MSTNAAQDWLAKQAGGWEQQAQRAKSSKFDKFPDGKYVGVLTSAELTVSRNDRPQVVWGWTITQGDYLGEKIMAYDGLDQEDSLYYLGRRIGSLGLDPVQIDIKKLQKHLDEIVAMKLECKLTLKTSRDGEFQNVYVDGVNNAPTPTDVVEDNVVDMSQQFVGEGEPVEVVEEILEEEPIEVVEEPVEEETVALAVGNKVEFVYKGEPMTGSVYELLKDKAKIKVGNKLYSIAYEELMVVDDGLDT